MLVNIFPHSGAVVFGFATTPKSMFISIAAYRNDAVAGKGVSIILQIDSETVFHVSLYCTRKTLFVEAHLGANLPNFSQQLGNKTQELS